MDDSIYIENPFKSAEQFLNFFSSSEFIPQKISHVTAKGRCGWIFRGQSDCECELRPSGHRIGNPLANFTPQSPGRKPLKKDQRIQHLGLQIRAELRAVHMFLENADKLGFSTPIDYATLKEHIELINAALKKNNFDYKQDFPSIKLVAGVALAQHYGVPTRFLDWTESPLVAAYFAAVGVSPALGASKRYVKKNRSLSVIYLFTPQLNKLGGLRIAQAPRHANNFLRVQKGLFTYLPSANDWFVRKGKWPSIEDIYRESDQNRGWLRRATLPLDQADNLLKLLWINDVTRHHVMPTLENAAKAFQYGRKLFE